MKIARKEGTNQLVTPQSKIVGESGIDTKSSIGELEKLNNEGNNDTSGDAGGSNSGNGGNVSNTTENAINGGMINGDYVKKLDYFNILKIATVRSYILGPLILGHFVGIKTMIMPELDKQSIPFNILASSLTWYGTYGLFKGKKHSLLYVFGGIGAQFFKGIKEAKE